MDLSGASRRRRRLSDSAKREIIARQERSGKKVAAFCRDEGLAPANFYRWKRQLAGQPRFVEVAIPAPFCSDIPVEIILPAGTRLVTSSACDPDWLAKFIQALGSASC